MTTPGHRPAMRTAPRFALSWPIVFQVVRWLAMVPAAILAWHVAILIGFALLAVLDALCPAEQMVSGLCVAPWFRGAEAGVFIFSAAFAGAALVAVCTLVAPGHRGIVAWTTLALGTLLATYLALETMAVREFVAAVTAGTVSAWLITRTKWGSR